MVHPTPEELILVLATRSFQKRDTIQWGFGPQGADYEALLARTPTISPEKQLLAPRDFKQVHNPG